MVIVKINLVIILSSLKLYLYLVFGINIFIFYLVYVLVWKSCCLPYKNIYLEEF